jgi:energy-coupling factor transport system permease protein
MIGNITLGQYIPGTSAIHRMDPRSKIGWTGMFMVLVFLMESWPEYLLMAGWTVVLLRLSQVPVRQSLKGLKPLLFLLAFTTLLNLFLIPGRVLVALGPLTITVEGLQMGVKIFFRLCILVIIASLMTLTTTPMSMTDGLERMMNPLKRLRVPVHEIAMMMSIALRFIPTLLEETERIMKAQASRGADFDTGNLFKRVKSFVPVLVPLFVSAFKRADELAEAMESRGYRGGEGRTRLKILLFSRVDLEAGLVCMSILAGFVLVRVLSGLA